jgi:DNA-directed RNA polymerase specialized sigma24 family protein
LTDNRELIVMLRYYTGLTVEETAGVVDRSVSTVVRDWRFARAWLAGRLGEGATGRERANG